LVTATIILSISKEEGKAERNFDELYVRAETGLGAEQAESGATLRPRQPVGAASVVSAFIR